MSRDYKTSDTIQLRLEELEGGGFYDFEMLAFGLCTEIFDNFGITTCRPPALT